MFNIGPAELIVILLVALLIVGPKRLPEVGKSVGKALREIRRQTDEVRSSFEMTINPDLDDDDDVHTPVDRTGSTSLVTEWGGEEEHEVEHDPEEAGGSAPPPDAPPDPEPATVDPVGTTSRRRRRWAAPPEDRAADDDA